MGPPDVIGRAAWKRMKEPRGPLVRLRVDQAVACEDATDDGHPSVQWGSPREGDGRWWVPAVVAGVGEFVAELDDDGLDVSTDLGRHEGGRSGRCSRAHSCRWGMW